MSGYRRGRDTHEELLEERVQDEERVYLSSERESVSETRETVVKMTDLTPDQRRLVSALIEAQSASEGSGL